jgi:hypothetical protein
MKFTLVLLAMVCSEQRHTEGPELRATEQRLCAPTMCDLIATCPPEFKY